VKYLVTIGAQSLEVELDGSRVVVGKEPLEAHLVAISGSPLYHLLLGGESWTVAAQPLEAVGRWALGAAGERVEVTAVDEQARLAPTRPGPRSSPTGGGTVVAPMPGLVVRIEVAVGQRVEAGAGLVVVEAMKMENELRAARAGVVETVHVTAGQAVEKGAPLVTITSAEPSG
jgi:biotin carboxyl carrier protein